MEQEGILDQQKDSLTRLAETSIRLRKRILAKGQRN